jgi:tetratricopeptide (TPR) repeat protein
MAGACALWKTPVYSATMRRFQIISGGDVMAQFDWRWSAVIGCLLAGLGQVSPAGAQTQQQHDACAGLGNPPPPPQQMLVACDALIQSGQFSGQTLAKLYMNRCASYIDVRNYDRAMADCNQALRIDPNYARAFSNRGLVYEAKGDRDRAIADFRKALSLGDTLAADDLRRLGVTP